MGVEEDRNAFISGSAPAPDAIRKKLFLLGYVNKKTKIIFEPGRVIAGNTSILISKVTYIKKSDNKIYFPINNSELLKLLNS